jgi:hypothetical protein
MLEKRRSIAWFVKIRSKNHVTRAYSGDNILIGNRNIWASGSAQKRPNRLQARKIDRGRGYPMMGVE